MCCAVFCGNLRLEKTTSPIFPPAGEVIFSLPNAERKICRCWSGDECRGKTPGILLCLFTERADVYGFKIKYSNPTETAVGDPVKNNVVRGGLFAPDRVICELSDGQTHPFLEWSPVMRRPKRTLSGCIFDVIF